MLLRKHVWFNVREYNSQIILKIFHNQEQRVELLFVGGFLSALIRRGDHLVQLRGELVDLTQLQLSQDWNLSEYLLTLVNIGKYIFYKFDGICLSRKEAFSFNNLAECSWTNDLSDFELLSYVSPNRLKFLWCTLAQEVILNLMICLCFQRSRLWSVVIKKVGFHTESN